jgi:protocatechuate 3,4-dioxygenase beta subunit
MVFEASFTRRRFLSTTLALGAALPLSKGAWAAQADPALCKLSPEQEVGPYYLDDELLRSDITEGKPGVPLILDIQLMDARRCVPLADAIVDIWQCGADGLYSGFTKSGPPPGPPPSWAGGPGGQRPGMPPPGGFDDAHGGPPPDGPPPGGGQPPGGQPPGGEPPGAGGRPPGPPPKMEPSDHLTFLRGIQRTNREGLVTFQSIVPGLYEGRTNHVHFKVRGTGAAHAANHVSHVGQIFFPETLIVQLMNLAPYRDHHIQRTTQSEDPVFSKQQGATSIARVAPLHGNDYTKGLRARIVAAVDPDATPQRVDPWLQGGARMP